MKRCGSVACCLTGSLDTVAMTPLLAVRELCRKTAAGTGPMEPQEDLVGALILPERVPTPSAESQSSLSPLPSIPSSLSISASSFHESKTSENCKTITKNHSSTSSTKTSGTKLSSSTCKVQPSPKLSGDKKGFIDMEISFTDDEDDSLLNDDSVGLINSFINENPVLVSKVNYMIGSEKRPMHA